MNAENQSATEMGDFERFLGIFTSPRETFVSIDRKPTWLMPFIIIVIVMIGLQLLSMDIGIKDRIADMQARDIPQEEVDQMTSRMTGPLKYIGLVAVPPITLLVWAILAGILLFGANTMMGGQTTFKKIFSAVAWSSLIGLVGAILKTLLTLSRGSTHGVATSLAILLPTPGLGQSKSVLYRLLERFDLFTVWTLFLWIIALAVLNRFSTKKSAILVGSLWAIYIVLSVALGGLFSGMTG